MSAVRSRFRSILPSLLFYAASGAISSYFLWHAINGERGLKVNTGYVQKLSELSGELGALEATRDRWRLRLSLMRGETVDRDLLDEEARKTLGRVDKNDAVILLEPN